MHSKAINQAGILQQNSGLQQYYFARAGFSLLWVLAAFTIGKNSSAFAAVLLLLYPAWDAAANLFDASRNGGLKRNPSQSLNAVVSIATTAGVALALTRGMHTVLVVFGIWACLAGLFQLATGVRRWSQGAQWAMILSGAQSALAGVFFIQRANGSVEPGIVDIAPYAAFGAFYFLVSAIWLTVAARRRHALA